MNGYVDKMVAEDPVLSVVVVEGQTETGHGSINGTLIIHEGLFYL